MSALTAVAALCAGLLVWPGHLLGQTSSRNGAGAPPARGGGSGAANPALRPGGPVPAAASNIVRQLVSGSPGQQRAALSPDLATVLPDGRLFPTGATLAVDPMSWRQDGDFANATGTLTDPGSAARDVDIGFVEESPDTWRVTYEMATS